MISLNRPTDRPSVRPYVRFNPAVQNGITAEAEAEAEAQGRHGGEFLIYYYYYLLLFEEEHCSCLLFLDFSSQCGSGSGSGSPRTYTHHRFHFPMRCFCSPAGSCSAAPLDHVNGRTDGTDEGGAYIGVNIGTALSAMPSPTQVVALLKSQSIRHVRLYDADASLLAALANTGIRVVVSVPNEQLLAIGSSNATAAAWVARNVAAHFPAVNISAIAVGSEVLTSMPNAAPLLLPAIRFLQSALVASNLDKFVKVSTPHSSSIILDSFPPSQAFFNRSLDPILSPLLRFLQSTSSPLFLNVYPYYDYMQSNGVIPLDYALFRPLPPNKEAVDANTLLHYTNVFDALVDAAYFAMAYLNVTNVPVVVLESGWPHKGDPSTEPDATSDNADTYNSNLIRHVMNSTGTPKHPGIPVPTYIYELYDEDQRPGAVSEKSWGLFDSTGLPAYTLHLSGSGLLLANDTTNQTFCVAREGADPKMLQAALDWACGPGKVDCSVLMQGQPCSEPDSVESHASYAFNAYYHGMGMSSGTCYFSGVAAITTTDPSHDTCIYAGSGGKNGTSLLNNTSLAPSANSTAEQSGSIRTTISTHISFLQLLVLVIAALQLL